MRARWVVITTCAIAILWIILWYIKISVVETDNRTSNALKVYDDNKEYDTMRNSIPETYHNPYFDKDMSLTISDFYWAGSRKSYLPAGESYDLTSYEAIKKVLRAGARVINLDIYPDSNEKWDMNANPVVRSSTMMPVKGSFLDFNECLSVIAENAWIDNKDYPLILYLEIHYNEKINQTSTSDNPHLDTNVFMSKRIASSIYEILGDRLLNKKYGFNCRNNLFKFAQIPISDILGKVAIVTNVYPTHGVLDELINSGATSEQEVIRVINYDANYQNYGGISGKHIETQDMIEHNRENLTIVTNPGKVSFQNIYDPKSDLYNPPNSDTNQFGCQITLMNYQLFDDNMKQYLTFFKDSSFVLKPDELRYIPKPPPVIKKQDIPNYYSMRTIETPGWFKLNY